MNERSCSNFQHFPWWRHQMETFSALLAICAENSPVPGEFPAQRPVTRSFDVFFDLRLNKRLSKQSRGWWFETLSHPSWRHCNVEHEYCAGWNSKRDKKLFNFREMHYVKFVYYYTLANWLNHTRVRWHYFVIDLRVNINSCIGLFYLFYCRTLKFFMCGCHANINLYIAYGCFAVFAITLFFPNNSLCYWCRSFIHVLI